MSIDPDSDDALALRRNPSDLSSKTYELMLDAYLRAHPERSSKSGRVRNPASSVRTAEERFVSAIEMNEPVSLADLCLACGVSKSVLYLAFQQWYSEPPIAYFHKRQLSLARTRLLNSEYQSGAVKRVAFSVGLMELGRFSQEYRQLYGELPSTTLHRSVPNADFG